MYTLTKWLDPLAAIPLGQSHADLGRILDAFRDAAGACGCLYAVIDTGGPSPTPRWLHQSPSQGWPFPVSSLWSCQELVAPCSTWLRDTMDGAVLTHPVWIICERTGGGLLYLALAFSGAVSSFTQFEKTWMRPVLQHVAALIHQAYRALPEQAVRIVLSPREIQCLKLAAQGKTSAETARLLKVTVRTVNFHLGNAFAKLQVRNKQAAVAQAIQLKYI